MSKKKDLLFEKEFRINEESIPYIKTNTVQRNIKKLLSQSKIEIIPMTILILCSLAELNKSSKGGFLMFRQACQSIFDEAIIPIISIISSKKTESKAKSNLIKVLAKWWILYLNIMDEIIIQKKNWNVQKQDWFT